MPVGGKSTGREQSNFPQQDPSCPHSSPQKLHCLCQSRLKTLMLKCGEVSPGPSLLTRTSCQQLCHCVSLLCNDIIHVCGHQIFQRSPGNWGKKYPKMLMNGASVMYITLHTGDGTLCNYHKECDTPCVLIWKDVLDTSLTEKFNLRNSTRLRRVYIVS